MNVDQFVTANSLFIFVATMFVLVSVWLIIDVFGGLVHSWFGGLFFRWHMWRIRRAVEKLERLTKDAALDVFVIGWIYTKAKIKDAERTMKVTDEAMNNLAEKLLRIGKGVEDDADKA